MQHMWAMIAASANSDSSGLVQIVEGLGDEDARDLAIAMAVITGSALSRMYGGKEYVVGKARELLLSWGIEDSYPADPV